MTPFRILQGNSANLPTRTDATIGQCYITTDTHKMYIDANNERFALNAVNADTAEIANKLSSGTVGNANSPVWFSNGTPQPCENSLNVSITGSSSSCTGNAATATKLKTARTITVGDASNTFNGSADINFTKYDIDIFPSKMLTMIADTNAGTTHFTVTDANDTTTLKTGKIIYVQLNSTPTGSGGIQINYNNSGYKPVYSNKGVTLTNYYARSGWKLLLIYNGESTIEGGVWETIINPDTYYPLKVSHVTSDVNYYLTGLNTAVGSTGTYVTSSLSRSNYIYMNPYSGALNSVSMQVSGGDVRLGTPSSSSNDSGDLLYIYGDGSEKCRIWSDDTYTSYHGPNWRVYDTSGTSLGSGHLWASGESITGAVWNDYAECRESDCEEAGYVLIENGDDTLSKSTIRLQQFAGISSDTWGFSQGETDKAKTHIAVAGRVLAYPYQDRDNYKPGDCVCAAPGGTVDIMTREEIINWPDRIVGTVSCVPDYEEWGGGKNADRDPVKVNGRIWIKVK